MPRGNSILGHLYYIYLLCNTSTQKSLHASFSETPFLKFLYSPTQYLYKIRYSLCRMGTLCSLKLKESYFIYIVSPCYFVLVGWFQTFIIKFSFIFVFCEQWLRIWDDSIINIITLLDFYFISKVSLYS